ncbi:unnamed protein product [Victoria cruziana]
MLWCAAPPPVRLASPRRIPPLRRVRSCSSASSIVQPSSSAVYFLCAAFFTVESGQELVSTVENFHPWVSGQELVSHGSFSIPSFVQVRVLSRAVVFFPFLQVDVAGKFIASGGIVEEYLPHRRASLPRSRCLEKWDRERE